MNQHRIVPFYMAYSMPYMMEEDTAARELEYLQQMFPEQSRRYAKKISDVIDRLDYRGSMIYDEYPDHMRIYALSQDIVKMIQAEEAGGASANTGTPGSSDYMNGMGMMNNGTGMMNNGTGMMNNNAEAQNPQNMQNLIPPDSLGENRPSVQMNDECLLELIYVLVSYEIFKRRHGNNNRIWVL